MNQKTILIIDTDATHRKLYTLLLAREGYYALSYPSVKEALMLTRATHIDGLLLTISHPELGGLTEVRRLNTDPHTSHLPLVAITIHPHAWREAEVRDAGADALIVTPEHLDTLVPTIGRLLAETSHLKPEG